MAAWLAAAQRCGAENSISYSAGTKLDWDGFALRGRNIQCPLHAMINEVAKSMHLTPGSARLTGHAARALSAPVHMADLMDTEDAVDTLDLVAKEMATRGEKRKKDEEEQAALEEAASLVRGQPRAAKRAAIGAHLPRE